MINDVQVLADQQGLYGAVGSVASTPTIWRLLDGVDEAMLPRFGWLGRPVGTGRGWPEGICPELS